MTGFTFKDVLKNLLYNFLSSALPTVILQFVVQPIIANKLGADLNGQYLTLMSLNFFVIGITASVLNTVRMLQNEEYIEKEIVGDFNIILLSFAILIIILFPIGYYYYVKNASVIDLLLYILIGILYLYHDYIFAQYRLKMQFNKILVNNIILIIGYFLGIMIFLFVNSKWQYIFITSYILSGIYDYLNTDFIKEPLKKTPLFRKTAEKTGALMLANMLNSSTAYFDKLILYPLLGGVAVSIYSTASLVGKILYLVSSPLNSLLLSYLVKVKTFRIEYLKNNKFVIICFVLIGYILCVIIGYPLTDLLYPKWADSSQIYIPITVAANTFMLVSNLINTILIRYYKMNYQIIIQAINMILYLIVSLVMLHFWGLIGFSIGVAVVAAIKMIILLVIIGKSSDISKNDMLT